MDDFSVDDLLTALGEAGVSKNKQVIYGLSDRSAQSIFVRFNDFFIDRQRVPLREKSYFFHLLSVMLDAGIPMLKALQVLADKVAHPRFKRVIATMAHQVEDGQHLSEVMAKFPRVFDDAEIGVVKSGEAIGRLDLMLSRLSDQLDRSYNVHLKLRGALTYPTIVVLTLVVATFIVMTFVVPRLQVFFEQSDAELPWLTRIVLGISEFTVHYWWAFILIFLIALLFGTLYSNTRSGEVALDYWKLKLPIVGDLIQKGVITKFVRLFGMLVASGLPITRILDIVASSLGNELYAMKVREVRYQVERGEKISEHLATTPFLFPEIVTQMLSIGERSATLDKTCEKLSDHYEREIEHSIKNMMTLLEPLVIIFVGIGVAILALAILGPVFSLSELV